MPKIAYLAQRFSTTSQQLIDTANEIIAEYDAQGFELTLRQLYYQFVARDIIPNTQKSYKNLGSVINNGRMAGLIDWNAIVDRTRSLRSNSHWEHPREIVEACAKQFQIDKWKDQKHRIEVWIEKDALVGVIERVCKTNDVAFFSCRGYTSQSEMWSAAMRLQEFRKQGQEPVIIHLGDHDPSGMDMTRDITDRMDTFIGGVDVRRIALNIDQVRKYKPPPNPAKLTDTRADAYISEFGSESWELDALEPKLLEKLIRDEVNSLRDEDLWKEAVEAEEKHKETLLAVAGEIE